MLPIFTSSALQAASQSSQSGIGSGISLFGGSLATQSLPGNALSTPGSFASHVSNAAGLEPAGLGQAGPAAVGFGLTGASAASTPFSDLLVQSVGQVDQLERTARSSIEGLISGKGVDVHEAMIATEKAEMGFDMAVAVRDKAISAYQQVMGMQF